MATDLTRVGKNNQKRGVTVAAFDISSTMSAAGDYNIANLPANAVVTNVFVNITKLDTVAATITCTAKIGTTAVTAGKNVGSGGSVAVSKSSTGLPIVTGDGAELNLTVATAGVTDAEATVIVEYFEPGLVTGNLTTV